MERIQALGHGGDAEPPRFRAGKHTLQGSGKEERQRQKEEERAGECRGEEPPPFLQLASTQMTRGEDRREGRDPGPPPLPPSQTAQKADSAFGPGRGKAGLGAAAAYSSEIASENDQTLHWKSDDHLGPGSRR